jgi:hypothetical protein
VFSNNDDRVDGHNDDGIDNIKVNEYQCYFIKISK